MWFDIPIPLLIFPILIGYWYLSRLNRKKFEFEEFTGYKVTYESIMYGIAITGISTFIVIFVITVVWILIIVCVPDHFAKFNVLLRSYFNIPNFALSVVILSIVLVIYITRKSNRKHPEYEILEQKARKSLMLSLVLDAIAENRLIEIVVSSNEVYIGWVMMGSSVTNKGRIENLSLLLYQSGYKNEEFMTVLNKAHIYGIDWYTIRSVRPDLRDFSDNEIIEKMGREYSIVLSMEEITSIKYGPIGTHKPIIETGRSPTESSAEN